MKINKKEKYIFWSGLLAGLMCGILGNIIVNTAFSFITESCKNMFCLKSLILIFITSIIAFILIIKLLLKKLKENQK
jgi:hypothetical protein